MGERRGTKGLELWCRKMTEGYPGVKIDNMTTSWRDGLAFCAIIHHFRPDLIDFEKLNKDDVYHNNELAFRVAEHHLGIPALLEPEDMVEYTVPDRLSILTYLSQFYQAFAVPQGSSSARIAAKRPQTSPDHGIVSPASTSPPTKVAFTGAGKIRREPCAKCGLPVFIAERLNVGKLLYHRTCFRCARCNSQLTLANYYETESGEYCCEICPDEEKIALKTSPEKSVLSRSMSDEEKTASLKTFSNEPDDYSALFETALENIRDDNLKKEFTLTRDDSSESTKARSEFFQSQMEDSGNEDEPPDLPKSIPPKLDKSELKSSENTISLKDSVVTNSANSGSGFPNNRLDAIVNMDISKSSVSNQYVNASVVELDKTHNIVTKDRSAEEGDTSLVKARMRLFESNKSTDIIDFRKSDVHRNSQNTDKVPLTSAKSPTHHSEKLKSTPIPIVKLDDLENFEQLSKKDLENDVNIIDDNKISTVPFNKDSFKHSNDDISDKYIGEKAQISKVKNTIATVSVFDKKSEIDTQNILNKESSLPSFPVKEELETDSKVDSSDVSNVDDSIIVLTSSDERQVSVIKKELETDSKVDSSDVSNVDDSIIVLTSSDESQVSVITVEDSPITHQHSQDADISLAPTKTDTSAETSFQTADISSDSFSRAEYKTTYDIVSPKDESPSDIVSPEDESLSDIKLPDAVETDEQGSKPTDEDYPDDLNPFDEDEEGDDEPKHKQANASLNPFEDDDDVEEEVLKPIPSPRLRKKLLPDESDKLITGTPEHLSGVYIQRISVNPFESDEEEGGKNEGKPPMPAARKKKVIAAPKISLNPFWSEDEENEDVNVKQPVPKPRSSRTTLGVPEPRPRESGGLSLSTRSNFGSNSSISSGSVYGSIRKKKPAPQPPTPAKIESYESTTSSLASSPSHSVQHSPRLNQKYRKSKKAPPPPPSSSTPLPPRREIEAEANRLSSTALSPIKLDSSESTVKDNVQNTENDIEQEKIVKDEMNRNRQSQNIGLQSPTDSETSSSISAPNKSTYGKWKRRKGQAPTRPIPQRRPIKCLPMAEIRRELEVIEIQQQGLERQGVRLEQIIREKCEGTGIDSTTNIDDSLPIDVEDLILQLFELVNEKNDLFRKQAELMYLRRQQRLEEEHADVEYQIRCLMLQPEANKTDSDKAREEELINRLVEIVERRNEIIECLEMDRVREAEEDDSINNHINLYTLKRDGEKLEPDKTKKEKDKDKKKHKKEKKFKHKDKGHKIDADKDIDESEPCSTLEKKKKKKFNIF